MPSPAPLAFSTLLFVAALASAQPAVPPDHAAQMARGLELFQGGVAGLLKEHCVKCHGGEKGVKGDFDLTTRELLLKGGEEGPAIVVGKSAESFLMKLIRHEEEPPMPKKADKLSDEAIARIAQWIDLGAPYAKPLVEGKIVRDRAKISDADRQWWAFRPLAEVVPPAAEAKNPIDAFIRAGLAEKGLTLSAPADARTLVRRMTFDLIGLPPTPAEVEAFTADWLRDSLAAKRAVATRLLASPHYGERWGRHWLDLARYAESHGYEQDYDRPNAWPYRDFVIRALNADQPYDEFVRWQIAGDELAPDEPEAWKATGFLAAGTHATQITANQAEKERYDELDDQIATIGNAMLGLSIGCARCHDHKFDPIPTKDYYRLISTFTTTVRSDFDVVLNPVPHRQAKAAWDLEHAPLVTARAQFESAELAGRFAAWEKGDGPASAAVAKPPTDKKAAEAAAEALQLLKLPAAERTPEQTGKLLAWFRPQDYDWRKLDETVAAHTRLEPKPETVKALICSEGVPAVRLHTQGPDFYETTYLLNRGDLAQKQGEAPQGFLQVLMRTPEQEQRWISPAPAGARTPGRRTSLAKWLTDTDAGAGPLLARVIVNRLWQHHFGRGLVATPSDFGAQGEKPTHPELLDWLAGELIRNGWRLKPLHQLMLTSDAYAQSSTSAPTARAADPENKLWSRFPRRRLEGEVIRDSLLAVTGVLDRTMGGAGSLDSAMKRRSIYFQLKRSQLPPMLATFDAPDTLQSMGQRASTTVAPQALHLMNNAQIRQVAGGWARSLVSQPIQTAVKAAYAATLSRAPDDDEMIGALDFLRSQTAAYTAAKQPDPAHLALTDFCQSLLCLNEFAYLE